MTTRLVMTRSLSALLIAVLVTAGTLWSTPLSAQAAGGELVRYTSVDGDYSVGLPESWEYIQDPREEGIGAVSPADDEFDFFRENVLVGSFALSSSDTLANYFQGNIDYLLSQLPDLEVVTEEPVELGGVPAMRITFTASVAGSRVRTTQVFAVKDGRGYIVTVMALDISYDDFSDEFEEVIASFEFAQ